MIRALPAVVVLLLLISPLAASDLSLVVGWTGVGSLKTANEDIDLKNFGVLGARFEKGGSIFGFENSLMYYTEPLCECRTGDGDGGLAYTGSVVLSAPGIKPRPFVVAGLGFLYKFGNSFPDFGTSLVINYGGGIKADRLVGPLGVRIDYRRLWVQDVLDKSVTTNEVTGGVMFSF